MLILKINIKSELLFTKRDIKSKGIIIEQNIRVR